jgi:predicted nucleic acid-binding protein
MKKTIFFDSWGWIAVADSKDPYHETAKLFFQEYLNGGGIPITTDYILDEVLTVLRRRLTHEVVVKFGEGIFQAVRVEKLRFELINNRRREKAWELFKKYQDKPDISFTDFTSFAVMSEFKIKEVFTGDEHFEKVNLDFKRVPTD